MSQQKLIDKLEHQIGFVFHRLNCDGNHYAMQVRSDALERAMNHFALGCQLFRESIIWDGKWNVENNEMVKTCNPSPVLDAINKSMRAFSGFDVTKHEDAE